MDLPIKKPSMVSYADDLDFLKVLEDISKKNHNGFIRVTSGSEEGYILFSNGEEVAVSYGDYLKSDAIERIKSAMDKEDTLVELFNVKKSQINFLMDLNKRYLLNSDFDVITELKKSEEPVEETKTGKRTVKNSIEKGRAGDKSEKLQVNEINSEMLRFETVNSSKTEQIQPIESAEPLEPVESIKPLDSSEKMESTNSVDSAEVLKHVGPEERQVTVDYSEDMNNFLEYQKPDVEAEELEESGNSELDHDGITSQVAESGEKIVGNNVQRKAPPLDRSALMKKYGIKEIDEDDVENILQSYKGGHVSEEDVDKIELTLMNKIKKSIFGIPKIGGAEVMVFLDNSRGLSGKVSVIIEYESKGFLSRMIGESKDINNLKRQVVNIIQIEIRKNFREYPEIIDKFDIDVEVS